MASVDLVFSFSPLAQPAQLVFGETEKVADYSFDLAGTLQGLGADIRFLPPVEFTVEGTLQGLGADVRIATVMPVSIVGTLAGLGVSFTAKYRSDTDRPLVARTESEWQDAHHGESGAGLHFSGTAPAHVRGEAKWQGTLHLQVGTETHDARKMDHTRTSASATHQDAVRVHNGGTERHSNALHDRRQSRRTGYREAAPVRAWVDTDWQERYRDRRPSTRSGYNEAERLHLGGHSSYARAMHVRQSRRSRYQEAWVPRPGVYVPPTPPSKAPCYTPDTRLLFADAWTSDLNLVFICENHIKPPPPVGETVVVPVKRVYIVINNTTLKRVIGGAELPVHSLSLSLDTDSWTWGFNATLPAATLDALMPDPDPVELEATINGEKFRLVAESVGRSREFAKASIKVTGRGRSAILAQPYAPILSFANGAQATAQQLANDALTFNGASIGWGVDWQIDDWLVPGGAFNVRGSYIDALNAIAKAAGAYVQPHQTDPVMQFFSRYPVAPWDWATVTPDFELPAAVTTREGIEWSRKTVYDRIFLSGTSQGVLADIKRAGTAGTQVKDMVTDPLMTDAVVATQRGRVELSDVGLQALVSLRLPILAETGVIKPGKFVRYVDGGDTKLGIVRSTNVDVQYPATWQSITVETHA